MKEEDNLIDHRKNCSIIPHIIYNTFARQSFSFLMPLQMRILTIPESRKERRYHTSFSTFPSGSKKFIPPSVMHSVRCSLPL